MRNMMEWALFIRVFETSYFHIVLTSYLTIRSSDRSDTSFAVSLVFLGLAFAYPILILYVMNSGSDLINSKKL